MENIVLNNLVLEPYRYKEHIDYDGLRSVSIRVHLSDAQFNEFKDILERGSFSILQKKIDYAPRPVMLSFDGWSKDESGVKCQITFVDREEKHRIRPIDPLWNLVPLVIKQGQIIEQLSNLLIQKGILEEEEYRSIEGRIPEKNMDKEKEIYYVKDLDEYEFED